MKGYSTFPKAPGLEPHHIIHIQGAILFAISYVFQGILIYSGLK